VTDVANEADAITLRMERDALGRLTVTHACGRSTLYRYDQAGQLVHTEVFSDDGRKRIVHDKLLFSYSKRGELMSETGHLGTCFHRYNEVATAARRHCSTAARSTACTRALATFTRSISMAKSSATWRTPGITFNSTKAKLIDRKAMTKRYCKLNEEKHAP
jgi:YD repeat-containing protein